MRRFVALILVVLVTSPSLGEPARAVEPRGLVIYAPAQFRAALAPLIELREGEGFKVAFLAAGEGRLAVLVAGQPKSLGAILLVGDFEPGSEKEPWCVPPKIAELYRWRGVQRETFASDSLWGDVDGDGEIDVPVGRIPARTVADVERAVAKILAWEKQPPSLADLRLNAWGGAPGYGGMIDAMATGMLVKTITQRAPGWVEPWILSASAAEPLCGHPPDHPRLFNEALRGGGVLHAMIAHADAQRVVSMRYEERTIAYGKAVAAAALSDGAPIAPIVFLTCESGRFDGNEECLAESLFAMPGGPVATIAATTESHPLPNYFSGQAMLNQLGDETDRDERPRIGAFWLAAQRRGAKASSFFVERMLKDAEGSLEDEIDVAKLRRDQPRIFSLLGDPLTRMRVPSRLDVMAKRDGDGWRWSIDPKWRTKGARLEVALLPDDVESPAKLPADADVATRRKAFEAANAAYRFAPIATLGSDVEWTGRVDRPGRLRVVILAPHVFSAGTVELLR